MKEHIMKVRKLIEMAATGAALEIETTLSQDEVTVDLCTFLYVLGYSYDASKTNPTWVKEGWN